MGAADFLRQHDRLGGLLSLAERLAALQRDCTSLLPTAFGSCQVLHLKEGQLVLAVPNASLAAKLKQQLPKLQENLTKRGWQVNGIRLKVQAGKIPSREMRAKELVMPEPARQAFAELENKLEDAPGNQALKAALRMLLERHGKQTGK